MTSARTPDNNYSTNFGIWGLWVGLGGALAGALGALGGLWVTMGGAPVFLGAPGVAGKVDFQRVNQNAKVMFFRFYYVLLKVPLTKSRERLQVAGSAAGSLDRPRPSYQHRQDPTD